MTPQNRNNAYTPRTSLTDLGGNQSDTLVTTSLCTHPVHSRSNRCCSISVDRHQSNSWGYHQQLISINVSPPSAANIAGFITTRPSTDLAGLGDKVIKSVQSIFSPRCNIYISPLCYDGSVRLSVTEVHWCIIADLGFKF